jgi:hypothetical protein
MQQLILIQLIEQFFAFMKFEGSVSCAQRIVNRFYPEPNKSSQHAHILFL